MPTASPAPRPSHREWSIDLLRALAVLLVMGHHGGYAGAGAPQPLAFALRVWNRSGWIGVDLFFVLSGFLVSGLLFREWQIYGRLQPGRFLARRGLKIYPAFYVYLAVTIVTRLSIGADVPWRTVASEALFVQNYGSRFLIHTWSLAVEEHFYLLLTLAFVLARGRIADARFVLRSFAWLAAAVLVGRCLDMAFTNSTDATLYMTHFRVDALSAGVALACVYHTQPLRFAGLASHRIALAIAAAALLFPAFALRNTDPLMATAGLTTTYAGFAALLILTVGNLQAETAPRWAAPLAYIGRYSYSIYLWHLPVRVAVIWLGRRAHPVLFDGAPGFVLYLAVSLLVGIALAQIVEVPGLYLRDRWFPSRTGVPTITVG